MQINLTKNYKDRILVNKYDKAIVLFFGLALWMFIPILGVFPLLLFVQLNHKLNSKLNLLIIFLVILTNTIFVSSLDVISDLAIYIDNYENLNTKTPWEISGEQGLEFIMWLVSYPIYIISNGSKYAFVFFWSFVFNAVTLLVIAKGLSPRNYGLLSMFIVATPIFFTNQGFLVRQYIASLIFLVAVIYAEKKMVSWGLYIISLFAHLANIIYLPILLLYNKASNFLNKKIVKIIILLIGILLPITQGILVNIVNIIAGFLPSLYGSILVAKTRFYVNQNNDLQGGFGFTSLENIVVFMLILFMVREIKVKTATEKILLFLHLVLLFFTFVGRNLPLFSFRFGFILYTFAGVFYYFLVEYKWKGFKKEILPIALVAKLLYFCYFLYNIHIGDNAFNYLDGRVFNSSVFDYIEIAHDGFVYDIEIKDLPDRTIRI